MSDEEIDPNTLSSLRVVDLKEELERRGLLKSGTKKELVERLRTYLKLERERKEIGNRSDHEAPNTKLLENKGLAGNDLVKQYLAKQQAMLTERSVSFMSDEGASSPDVSRSEVPSKTTPVVEVEPVTSAGSTQPGTSSASDSSPLSGRSSRSSSRRDRLKTQHESGATPCRAAAAATDLSARRSRRTRSSDSTSAEPGHDGQAEEEPVDYSMHAAADDKLKNTERVDAAAENEAIGTPECVKADEPVVGESPRVEPEPQASTKPIGEKTAVVAKLPQQEVKRHTQLAAKPQKNSITTSSTAEAGQCEEKPSKETPSKHSIKVSSADSVPVDKSAPVLPQSLKKDTVSSSVAAGDKAAASADTKHDNTAPPPSSDHKPSDTDQSQHTEPARTLPDKTERHDHQTCSVASHCDPEPGTESLKKTAAPSDDSGKNVHCKLNAELCADAAAVEQTKTDTGSGQTNDQLPSKNETTCSIASDTETIDGDSKSTTNESKHAASRSTDQQMETTSEKLPKLDRKRVAPVTEVIEVSKTAAAAAADSDSLTAKHVAVKHTASAESPAGVSKSNCDLPKVAVKPATEVGCKDTVVTSKTDVLSAGTREVAKARHVSCDDKLKRNKAEESDSKSTAVTSSHSPSLSAPTESKSTAPNVSKDASTIQDSTSVASVSRDTKSQKSVSNSSDKSSKPSPSAKCGPSERVDGGQDGAQSTEAPKQSAFKRPADKVDGVAPVGAAGSSPGSADKNEAGAPCDGVSPPSRGDRKCSSVRATVTDSARAVGERKPLIRRRVVSPVEHSSPSPSPSLSPSITTTTAAASASSQSHETRPSSAARGGAGTPVEDTGDDVDCLEMERSEWLEDSDFWSAAKSEREPSVSQPVIERVSRRARVSDLPSSSPQQQQQRHSSSVSVSKSSSSVDKRTRSDGSGDESGVVAAKERVVSETEGGEQQQQRPATADSSGAGQPATKFRRIMVHRKSSNKKSQSAGQSSSWNRVNVHSSATISISSDSLNALLPCTPSLSATPAGNGAVSDAADAVSSSHTKRHSSSVSPPRANGDHSAPQHRHSPSPPATAAAAAPPGTSQQRHRHTSRDQSAARVEEGPQPPPSIRRTITQRVGDAAAGGGGSSSMTAAAAGGRSDQLLERPPSPARYQVSSVVFLRNLVRPFTVAGLKELLARTGTITDFWINNIKSKCCCQYESVEQAVETRTALHRVRWPPSNPKLLLVDYGSEQMLADYKAADQIAAGACPAPVPLDPHFATRQQEQLRQQQQQQQRRETVREWDKVKLGERSPGEKERERERKRAREAAEQKAKERQCEKDKRQAEETAAAPVAPPIPDTPVKLLDDLFRKTVTTPCIYWLPLTEQQIADRHEERRQRALERQKRLAERRDVSAADHRSRSRSRHR